LPSITSTSPGRAIAIAGMDHQVVARADLDREGGTGDAHRAREGRDAPVHGAAAAGHVGEDRRGEGRGRAHRPGRDALEVAADVGEGCGGLVVHFDPFRARRRSRRG
jgi:hypothetical protein